MWRFGRNPAGTDSGLTRSSQVVVHNGTAYLVATPDKPWDASISAGEQMRQVLARIEDRLASVGGGKSSILFCQIWLSDLAYFDEINSYWDRWIDQEQPPVRCCGGVALADPGLKVEVIVIAAVENSESRASISNG